MIIEFNNKELVYLSDIMVGEAFYFAGDPYLKV